MSDQDSLMRGLGRFVGSLGSNFRAGLRGEQKQQVNKTTEEHVVTDPEGRKITLRRTTVEEIEVREDGETSS